MSDYKWGDRHVYVYRDRQHVQIYWWQRMKMYKVKLKINSDNSLHMFDYDYLMPVMMWHEIAKHSDKIITYLMLKRN